MTNKNLEKAILKVATATGETKEQIAAKMMRKDNWTWFLVREAEKSAR